MRARSGSNISDPISAAFDGHRIWAVNQVGASVTAIPAG